MGWSLLPNALRPFKIYCASPSITSQLVLFLWQTVEIDPLGHVRVVEGLQNFVQKCDEFHHKLCKNKKFHNPQIVGYAEKKCERYHILNCENTTKTITEYSKE